MSHRTRQDVTVQILEAAANGETKTKIMYKTFLSHDKLQKYLDFLIEKGLIGHDGMHNFKTTERGRKLIKLNNQMKTLSQSTRYQDVMT